MSPSQTSTLRELLTEIGLDHPEEDTLPVHLLDGIIVLRAPSFRRLGIASPDPPAVKLTLEHRRKIGKSKRQTASKKRAEVAIYAREHGLLTRAEVISRFGCSPSNLTKIRVRYGLAIAEVHEGYGLFDPDEVERVLHLWSQRHHGRPLKASTLNTGH